jgi:cytochrome P450
VPNGTAQWRMKSDHSYTSMTPNTRITPAPGPQGRALTRSVQRLQHQMLAEHLALHKQFGDVVHLSIWPHPLYLISHPDDIQHILRENASNYRKGILFRQIAALQGQGLLTSEGALWRRQRRLAQPAFRQQHLALFGSIIQEEAQAVVHGWSRAARTGEPVNVTAWMHRLTFRVVGRVLLGLTPESLDDLGRQLQAVGRQIFPYLTPHLRPTWTLPAWIPTPRRQRFRRAIATYNAIAQQVITMRRQALQHNHTASTDLLALLITADHDETGEGMTEQQLRDEVITFIGAGVETSAQALSWTWYLLACYPEVAQKVQAELETVTGTRLSMPEDLPCLPYCRMVLDEILRLYPPAAILPRQANAADVIGGYAIPKNAVVLMSQYVTHRHPAFWPEPEHFCPERFTPAQTAARHRFAYLPFGEGPRVCIGKPLALMELQLALATIAQVYSLRLLADRPVVPHLATTLQPQDGLWMTVQARQ